MNTIAIASDVPLTHQEKEIQHYREELEEIKEPLSQYRWDFLMTIRQGKGHQFKSFTNTGDSGYLNRERFAKQPLGRIRQQLSLSRYEFHYYIFHEFGDYRCGHLHIPCQIVKARSYKEIDSAVSAQAQYWKDRQGFLIHHYYKKTQEIFIRSNWKTIDYLCKPEEKAFDSQGYPLWKKPTASPYLERYGERSASPLIL